MPSKKKKKGISRSSKKSKRNASFSSSSATATAAPGSTNNARTVVVPPPPPPPPPPFLSQQGRWTEEKLRLMIGKDAKLIDFPMSKYYVVGRNLKIGFRDSNFHNAAKAFRHGIEVDGCLWCMSNYATLQISDINGSLNDKFQKSLPWCLEGAIRGHTFSITLLLHYFYDPTITTTHTVRGLRNFWTKIKAELDRDDCNFSQQERKAIRDEFRSKCGFCGTTELPDQCRCAGCRCYAYCSKECQRLDWFDRNHRGECRQLKLLKHHYRNQAKDIRTAITDGNDPKTIRRLQKIRTKLGLNQPRTNCERLVKLLEDDNLKAEARFECITGRPKDGTVHIGSTPNTI